MEACIGSDSTCGMPKEVHAQLISMLERLNTDTEHSKDSNSLSTLQQEGGEADNKDVSDGHAIE